MKNILIFFGGASSEYNVSLSSAHAVLLHLDPDKYRAIPVGITREGDWFYYPGSPEHISDDTWHTDPACIPALLSQSRTNHRLLLLKHDGIQEIPIDAAFPVLHGINGEDGTLQGLIELSGIPLVGCGTLSSALCMDKDRAHKVASLTGVRVPRSLVLDKMSKNPDKHSALLFADEVGYPLFVKPVKAGSSFGVSKVNDANSLLPAIELAFQYDTRVILEENIEGFEVGCAVLGTCQLITGEVDEIRLSGSFFDFTEKYTLKTSSIRVPALLSPEKTAAIKEVAITIFKALDCKGFARVDLFLTPSGEIVFNEVNTIPGFTEHSRYPGMMRASGYTLRDVLDMLLEQTIFP